MILGVDASNIRAGGGITHLTEFLSHADPASFGFSGIIVWSSESTLSGLEEKPWLIKKPHPLLNGPLIYRLLWQKLYLDKEARRHCNILFLPSGNTSGFHPHVSMCQNLLPFEPGEKAQFGISLVRARYELLKWNQCRSFINADGVVFLSNHSIKRVEEACGRIRNKKVIPHGVSDMFRENDRSGKAGNKTTQILYVSIINHYKHQDQVVRAVHQLLDSNYDVRLMLIGPAYPPALKKLQKIIGSRPEYVDKVEWIDRIPYEELANYYRMADIFVFASSCETFGMILLEAMASGAAIACSELSSMKEIAEDAVIYFNPYDVKDIAAAIQEYLDDPDLRSRKSAIAKNISEKYSWERSANETLAYLGDIRRNYLKNGSPSKSGL